jgi:hypothetical protein
MSLRACAFFNHLCKRPLDIGERREDDRFARVEYDIPVDIPLRVGAMQPERRSQPPFDSIANHRSAERLGYGEPDANSGSIAFARLTERGEQGRGYAGTVIINCSEIGGAQNARGSRESLLAAGAGFNGKPGRLFRR